MKVNIYIIITSGRGPVECNLAVHGIQQKFQAFLNQNQIEFKIAMQKAGPVKHSIGTIIFEVSESARPIVAPWIGTIKWVCNSPIRKGAKRKNWFIKCELIESRQHIQIDRSQVSYQTFRASGPGGQHRNKVETAIRLIHHESGISVTASDGKSQHQNKKKAWEKFNLKIDQMQTDSLQKDNLDRWLTQIEIDRGNPVKVFKSINFTLL